MLLFWWIGIVWLVELVEVVEVMHRSLGGGVVMSRDQQTARVNVSGEEWIQFRILAMRRQQSLAEYLGELVRAELAGPVGTTSSPKRRRPRQTRATTPAPPRRPSPTSVRLADQRLLTELPKPNAQSREQ